jgi:hypothetical protein
LSIFAKRAKCNLWHNDDHILGDPNLFIYLLKFIKFITQLIYLKWIHIARYILSFFLCIDISCITQLIYLKWLHIARYILSFFLCIDISCNNIYYFSQEFEISEVGKFNIGIIWLGYLQTCLWFISKHIKQKW